MANKKDDFKKALNDFDTDKLISQLPAVKKDVAKYYFNNCKVLRDMLEYVYRRKPTQKENYTLRLQSFRIAEQQVARAYTEKKGYNFDELKKVTKGLHLPDILSFLDELMGGKENE